MSVLGISWCLDAHTANSCGRSISNLHGAFETRFGGSPMRSETMGKTEVDAARHRFLDPLGTSFQPAGFLAGKYTESANP